MPQITPTDLATQLNANTKSGRPDTSKMEPANTAAIEGDAPTIAPASPSPEDPNSSKFLELAKRTKANRALQMKLQQEQQSIEQAKAEMAKKNSEYETNYIPKERLKSDLLGVLTELGYDPNQVAQAFQSGPVNVDMTIRKLQKEIAELKAGTETVTKTLEQNKVSQFDAAVNNVRSQAKALVAKDPTFETIKAMGKEEDIVQHILKVFNEGETDAEGNEVYPVGHVLDVTDVATQIEEKLLEEALRFASLEKVKKKLAPPPVEETPESIKQKITPHTKQTPIKTLTNTMTASPSKSLSHSERRARAIAIARGESLPT